MNRLAERHDACAALLRELRQAETVGKRNGKSMSMQIEDLEMACGAYEAEHGIEAFLDAMAEIMRRRMARHGLQIEFDRENDDACHFAPATQIRCHAGPAAK